MNTNMCKECKIIASLFAEKEKLQDLLLTANNERLLVNDKYIALLTAHEQRQKEYIVSLTEQVELSKQHEELLRENKRLRESLIKLVKNKAE